MRITVTEEDIAIGKPLSAFSCPIALAVQNCMGVQSASVATTIHVYDSREWPDSASIYTLPTRAYQWMTRFDAGKPVKPFNFLTEKVA